jgi:hypothetical protein
MQGRLRVKSAVRLPAAAAVCLANCATAPVCHLLCDAKLLLRLPMCPVPLGQGKQAREGFCFEKYDQTTTQRAIKLASQDTSALAVIRSLAKKLLCAACAADVPEAAKAHGVCDVPVNTGRGCASRSLCKSSTVVLQATELSQIPRHHQAERSCNGRCGSGHTAAACAGAAAPQRGIHSRGSRALSPAAPVAAEGRRDSPRHTPVLEDRRGARGHGALAGELARAPRGLGVQARRRAARLPRSAPGGPGACDPGPAAWAQAVGR